MQATNKYLPLYIMIFYSLILVSMQSYTDGRIVEEFRTFINSVFSVRVEHSRQVLSSLLARHVVYYIYKWPAIYFSSITHSSAICSLLGHSSGLFNVKKKQWGLQEGRISQQPLPSSSSLPSWPPVCSKQSRKPRACMHVLNY